MAKAPPNKVNQHRKQNLFLLASAVLIYLPNQHRTFFKVLLLTAIKIMFKQHSLFYIKEALHHLLKMTE